MVYWIYCLVSTVVRVKLGTYIMGVISSRFLSIQKSSSCVGAMGPELDLALFG